MKRWILALWAMGVMACLAGCGATANTTVSLNGETAGTNYHIINDAQVVVSPIRVYVKPNISPTDPLRGLFVPLRVTQDIASPRNVSHNISRQIWQVWLAQKSFQALEYDDRMVPFQVSDALQLARSRGANVLVGGYITHLLDGGSAGASSISIQMEVYEVATGTLLWSMGQGGSIEKQQPVDLFIFGVEQRMPADAMGLTARSVGYDMGMKIADWVKPPRGHGAGQVF